MTTTADRRWTDYVRTCEVCGRRFRISQEALDMAREDFGQRHTDAEIAETFDFCLACVDGIEEPGEHLAPDSLPEK